jgi:hypothetical protein
MCDTKVNIMLVFYSEEKVLFLKGMVTRFLSESFHQAKDNPKQHLSLLPVTAFFDENNMSKTVPIFPK